MTKKFKGLIVLGALFLIFVALYNQQIKDEKFLLNPPTKESPKSLKDQHMQIVTKLSRQGSSVELDADCQPSPLALEIKKGADIEFKNKGSKKRLIMIDGKHVFEIEPNSSKLVKADFKYGPGDYGYVCSGIGLIGFLDVLE